MSSRLPAVMGRLKGPKALHRVPFASDGWRLTGGGSEEEVCLEEETCLRSMAPSLGTPGIAGMTAAAQAPADTWIRRHRLIFYFALTYAISWPLWLLFRLAGGTLGTALLVVGAFGPLLAAAITIRYSGGSMRSGFAPSFAGGYRFTSMRTPSVSRC